MTSVGLHMIVKNEAHVIERCLSSVLPLVDWWVVADTGSTDGTQDLVRRVMGHLPGRLVEHEWVNFGHNRQLALEAARDLPESSPDDVALWIDADDELVELPTRQPGEPWLVLPAECDGLTLEVRSADVVYQRTTGVRLGRAWTWREPVHEYLELDAAAVVHLPAPVVLERKEGARSRHPDTYAGDARLLEEELERRPGDARTQFYLAQSLADAGDLERAAHFYRIRAANSSGWESERCVALHRLAVCLERAGRGAAEVAEAYADAWEAAPHRAESLVEWARVERTRGRRQLAHLLARRAVELPRPAATELFVDTSVPRWRALDEYAVCCGWTGRFEEGERAARQALAAAPGVERLRENVAWFESRRGSMAAPTA